MSTEQKAISIDLITATIGRLLQHDKRSRLTTAVLPEMDSLKPVQFYDFLKKTNFPGSYYDMFGNYFKLPNAPEFTFAEYWQGVKPLFKPAHELTYVHPVKLQPVATWQDFWKIVNDEYNRNSIMVLLKIASKIVQESIRAQQLFNYSKFFDDKQRKIHFLECFIDTMGPIESSEVYWDLLSIFQYETTVYEKMRTDLIIKLMRKVKLECMKF